MSKLFERVQNLLADPNPWKDLDYVSNHLAPHVLPDPEQMRSLYQAALESCRGIRYPDDVPLYNIKLCANEDEFILRSWKMPQKTLRSVLIPAHKIERPCYDSRRIVEVMCCEVLLLCGSEVFDSSSDKPIALEFRKVLDVKGLLSRLYEEKKSQPCDIDVVIELLNETKVVNLSITYAASLKIWLEEKEDMAKWIANLKMAINGEEDFQPTGQILASVKRDS